MCKLENIRFIYEEIVSKKTKNKRKVLAFDNYYMQNIFYIKYLLSHECYTPNKYNIFLIKEPKVRLIMSQTIQDKVINHLVSNYILRPVIEPILIDTNVATRKKKGTRLGVTRLKKYINEIKLETECFYILKFDISKYFYSIDHEVLKSMLQRKIKDKKALKIIYKIIDSTNEEYINEVVKSLKSKNKELDIPHYQKGKGLPIGNMTSQILALLYLNELDHFIKERLHIKYYIRYMDDGILIHQDKWYLKYCLRKIQKRIEEKQKLKLNPKTKLFSIKESIEYIGYRYLLKKKRLLIKIKRKTKKKMKKSSKVENYKGYVKYAKTKNLVYEKDKRYLFYLE